jgi:hypothetical protein
MSKPYQPLPPDSAELLDRIQRLSYQLDARYTIRLIGVPIGWDVAISIVPVIGDLASAMISVSMIRDAQRLGVDKATLARMAGNLAFDVAAGMIPFAGSLFDIFWRANMRNLALVVAHVERAMMPR